MKKILIKLGLATTIAIPICAVVSCDESSAVSSTKTGDETNTTSG